MESKGIRFLLIAILAALVLLLIPSWGMFLSGLRSESVAVPAKTITGASAPMTETQAENANTPVSSVMPEPTVKPLPTAIVLGEPDAEGWVKVSLPFFKEPVMAKATLKEPNVAYITVKVSKGMEIMAPALCAFGRGGVNGKDSVMIQKNSAENQMSISIDFEKMNYIAETGLAGSGTVLGTFDSDGEADIRTSGLKPQQIAQTDIAAWFNTALEMVLGE